MSSTISRNAPCPCGSGQRYKHCCGAATPAQANAATPAMAEADGLASALSLHQSGRIDEAERIYRSLLEAGPDNPRALHYLGVCRYQKGDPDKAVRLIRAALALEDGLAMAYNNLGLALTAAGRLEEARLAYDRALEQDPDNALAYNNRGLILHQLRCHEEALLDYEKALRPYYHEKIVYLPHCYQVNDSTKAIAERDFSRAELGLPETAFVFCCFNNSVKITPDVFDIWMRLLRSVDGSVLWLCRTHEAAVRNLVKEAAQRGVSADRLVFADRLGLADYLARYRAADLFLDTFHFNAGTTASDALWAGLPVLTRLGDTFAGRMAASLLDAVGLPELIAADAADYEARALELATRPDRLTALRKRLAANRGNQPLFDTPLFTRHIETAYLQMHARHQAGLAPDHIFVDA